MRRLLFGLNKMPRDVVWDGHMRAIFTCHSILTFLFDDHKYWKPQLSPQQALTTCSVSWMQVCARNTRILQTVRAQRLIYFLCFQKSVRSCLVKPASRMQDCAIFSAELTDAQENDSDMWRCLSSAAAGPKRWPASQVLSVHGAPRLLFQHQFCLVYKCYHFKNIFRRG